MGSIGKPPYLIFSFFLGFFVLLTLLLVALSEISLPLLFLGLYVLEPLYLYGSLLS
jgi:hypothetical protein